MMIHELQTDEVKLTLDSKACLHTLASRDTAVNYAGGYPVWRIYLEDGQRFQIPVVADAQTASIESDGSAIRFHYPELSANGLAYPIAFRFEVTVEGDETRWRCEIENHSAGVVVKEVHFPLVGNMQGITEHTLITTAFGGLRHKNPIEFVRGNYPPTHHWYGNADHEGLQAQLIYPGCFAASNCFVLAARERGLYFGSHDDSFRNTVHLFRLEKDVAFEAGMAKHVFVKPGESLAIDGYRVAPYRGTWHVAADKYRTWCRSWFERAPAPKWMEGFRGWQRLILKHQNGDILFPYDAFPEIFTQGKKAGIDALFMFGWWPGGMDRMYPDYVPDPELGGEEKLRENIRKFQDELGGTVIFYASGRLVDRQSEFYKRHGSRLAIKTRSGAESRDAYLFSNSATYERLYGAVELTPMCLDCPEWVDVLKRIIDQAADYGCKAVFFDQLGLQEYPCYDPNHGHPVPYVLQTQGKRRVIAELRDYCKSRYPEMAFGVEVFADAIGQYFDFVHGLYHQNYIAKNPDYQARGVKPDCNGFIEWMRYVYPEVPISDRDIRDGNDVERRVNYTLLVGLLHDVEIYRCRKTIDEVPHYQDWLAQVNSLRDRFGTLLTRGTYRDTLGLECSNDAVEARCFESGGLRAIVATQSHLEAVTATLTMPGWILTDVGGIAGFEAAGVGDGSARLSVPRHALGVTVWKPSGPDPS